MALGSWRDCPSLCGSTRLPPPQPSQERGAQGPLPNILRSVPRHGQWPRPTHWSLAIVIAPCLVLPKPEGQHVEGDGHGQRGHRQAPAAHIHYSVCLSVRSSVRFFFLHVRSGLGYPAMPLSCLPSWTPGPRVFIHSDTCQSGQLTTLPSRQKEQGTSGHDRA